MSSPATIMMLSAAIARAHELEANKVAEQARKVAEQARKVASVSVESAGAEPATEAEAVTEDQPKRRRGRAR